MEHHHVPIQACGEELAVLSHRRSHFLNAIEWWECPHLLDDLRNLIHRPKTTFTQKVTSAASAGAKAGATVKAKSKSVFKRFASSFVGWARRQRGAEAGPEVASPATSPATTPVSVGTATALSLGILAAAGSMTTGYGI